MTADTQTPPDWVLTEAVRRSNSNQALSLKYWRDMYETGGMFAALCDMIHRYEAPPVDPDLIEAREIVATLYPFDAGPCKEGKFDGGPIIESVLAGIKRGRELERGA